MRARTPRPRRCRGGLHRFVVLPPVSVVQFRGLDCAALQRTSDEHYLKIDTEVDCSSAEYKRFFAVNCFFILLYQSALLGAAWALHAHRDKLDPVTIEDDPKARAARRNQDPSVSHLRFLFRDHKCRFYYWEIVDMCAQPTRRTEAAMPMLSALPQPPSLLLLLYLPNHALPFGDASPLLNEEAHRRRRRRWRRCSHWRWLWKRLWSLCVCGACFIMCSSLLLPLCRQGSAAAPHLWRAVLRTHPDPRYGGCAHFLRRLHHLPGAEAVP